MVWETLIDVERVAPCLPGAEISGSTDDVYEGAFTVKLGPTAAAYAGKLEMEEVDEAAHRVTMKASGRDKRGQGSANATIESSMREAAGVTTVEVVTDFTLTGRWRGSAAAG
jgi:carbon monoxide dehydrogenase subunit G